ncbi:MULTISPECIES: excinuclease ABC subunit UvrC [Snodgrassella]|uniref:excinuclease ABC subunit UvrC n=1 Tax=Snodgrassella TaxID=1193515 RepID=UPI000C1F564E|nr:MULTISPECIES: excinuclease ABC subunit UvrC [Snodgrassella]NUE65758.1 excinuclease ABC subunit UvrC [Snodgrassella sp. ESL0253]PIT13422.1 excinuclease ABC subunit C [Snodgrassella alvi]PIT15710.1 excinuclease ABC subunit C [Snodgrassella alvi]
MNDTAATLSSPTGNNKFDLAVFLKNLPLVPGVYRMLDANDKVLYVGKAVNLKRRVSSYFQKTDLSPRIQLMVKQVARIEITATHSETEALILENNLIKALSPKYNILFRDDKSYPYLMLSGHRFAQMAYYRGTLKKPNQYFGPYPNGYAVRNSIQTLQKVFRLRTCEDSVFEHRDRACLLYQIKRCSGPCVGHISVEDYQSNVKAAVSFLQGKTSELTASLHAKMQQAAEQLNFETAAQIRDQIQALGLMQSQQFIDSKHARHSDIDILALTEQNDIVCIHWVSIRGGRHVGDKNFFPDTRYRVAEKLNHYGEAFVAQHYLGKSKPDIIISNFQLPKSLCDALNAENSRQIQFVHNTVGERRIWLQMAERNAQLAIEQHRLQQHSQQHRIEALAQLLDMDAESLNRIECFDISHTQGEATIASCVVYEDEAMQPAKYRRYNITTAKAGDDYAAMREVLTRRYGRLADNDESIGTWPDLVLIDGGKGQVHMALDVWQELGIHIPIVGIAKGPERKAGLEELIIPHQQRNIRVEPHNPALHLLQTVRDESHRFAITGHRQKRAKARVTSSLNDIPGIGSKRRQALLTRFGGLRGVVAASVHDLSQTEGISLALAEKIYAALH